MEIVKALYYFSINLKTVFFDFSGAVGGGVGGVGGRSAAEIQAA